MVFDLCSSLFILSFSHVAPRLAAMLTASPLSLDNDPEASRKFPEQLQNRNVKRDASNRQPDSRRIRLKISVHRSKEVAHLMMRRRDALWTPSRTRGVDDISQI